jgi:hypothetical protein
LLRVRTEIPQRQFSDDSPIVIPGKTNEIKTAQSVDALIRLRSIADDISEAPHLIKSAGVLKYRIERDEIGVNIGNEQDSHAFLVNHSITDFLKEKRAGTESWTFAERPWDK